MKIGPNLSSFAISAKGMSVQKKKMDIVAENIANASTTKAANGEPYKKKFLLVEEGKNQAQVSAAIPETVLVWMLLLRVILADLGPG